MTIDIIQKSLISLLTGRGVFYAALMMQMHRREGIDLLPEGALAAVQVINGRIELLTNCELYKDLTLEQVCYVLEHELLHVILEHSARAPHNCDQTWGIATDLAVNSLLPGIDLGLIPGRKPFENVPTQKNAEFYYELLRNKNKFEIEFNDDGTAKITDKKTGKSATVKLRKCSSAHKDEKSKEATALAREVLKQVIQEAHDYSSRTAGGPPAELESILKEFLKKNAINWKQLLRQYIGSAVKANRKYTWKRESKRFGVDQKGKSPDRILQVGVSIDTSGSISDRDLSEFIAEMKGIQRAYKSKIFVVECGTEINRKYWLSPTSRPNMKFFGRGGGTFLPVFKYYEEEHPKRPDILVVFSDMFEEMPKSTRLKTLWIRPSAVADHPAPEPPFGRVLQIPKHAGSGKLCPVCNQPGCNCNAQLSD